MKNADELLQENQALRARMLRLHEATLRVNASLDLSALLQEIVDSIRALTSARYGAITTTDEAGQVLDFVTSGLTPEESRRLAAWADGPRLFDHLRNLPGTVRLHDLSTYARSLGLSSRLLPAKALQATPMHRRGARVGDLFIGDKNGEGAFTHEDEEVLQLFASQAATAIANARAHRDEQRARVEFLSMVSHELRAPLTSIKGSAATVLEASQPPDPAEAVQFFRIIDQQADLMRSLINDLLDAGCIEAGTLSVAPEPVAVATLVDQSRNTFLSGGGRHAVRIELPPDLPQVMADRQRIVQVLNNLLSNASRHSPAASPIRIDAFADEGHVAVSVSDEGRGVPREQLRHLFRKHAVGVDRKDAAKRSGLGLSICKGLVEAHGGRIWAENGRGNHGTRFTFTVPVAGAVATRAPNASRPHQEGWRPASVLVLDDDPQMLRYIRDALAAAGHAPLATGDPRELPHLLNTHKPHLVLLDLLLPGADGIELMQRVPELADVPVIFISGYGRDETIARALELGAADYLVKPFSSTELVARVHAALRDRAEPEPFLLADLAIHYEERRVTVADRTVELTALEYELLHVLSVNAGRVLTYDALLRKVWGRRSTNDARAVRAQVKKLRRKLGDSAAKPVYLRTERGVGYRMPRPGDR